jgi:hypothetical protein
LFLFCKLGKVVDRWSSAGSTSGSASSTCVANQNARNTVITWISSEESWLPSLEQTLVKPVTTSGNGVLPYQAQGVPLVRTYTM